MQANRKLTLGITLIAALLMAVLTTGSTLAQEGTEIITGLVDKINDDGTIDIAVNGDPGTEDDIITVKVGQDFDMNTISVGANVEVMVTPGEAGTLVLSGLKILERLRDKIQLQEGEGDPFFCESDKVHPVVESIAGTYNTDDLMKLLCGDNQVGLGQAMLALQTSILTGDDYLTDGFENISWGKVWQDYDELDEFTGKPEKGVPTGEIQKQDDGENPQGKDVQGKKNQDGTEAVCDELFCEVSEWFQSKKGKK